MPANLGALVVFGSGPGIGSHVAALFASRGFGKVVLLSRNAQRLEEDASFVKSKASGVSVETVTINLSDLDDVGRALQEVDKRVDGTPLECVLFNAARVGPSNLLEWTTGELENDLKISVVSFYAVAQWAIPQLQQLADTKGYKPSLLVTSGGLYKNPFPQRFSLATCKAAQFNMVHSFYKAYTADKGDAAVHCALIVVQGQVREDAKVTTPSHIAEETWKLYDQEKGEGELFVDIVDPDYNKPR